jgi:hypothetical protein
MFPSSMAYTKSISVLLSWLQAAIRGQNQGNLATSQRAHLTCVSQCPGPIMATQVPKYTSLPTMEVLDKGMSCSATSDCDASSLHTAY